LKLGRSDRRRIFEKPKLGHSFNLNLPTAGAHGVLPQVSIRSAFPCGVPVGTKSRMPTHLPGLNGVDASATKNFRLTKRAPNTLGCTTSASQRAGAATDGRVIQFGLKLQF
jgi:hypothetical protein